MGAYQDRLESPEWFRLRNEVDARCGGICERCHQRRFENLHHLHYRTVGHESLDDVQGLCRTCHETVHGLREDDMNTILKTEQVKVGKVTMDAVWFEGRPYAHLQQLILSLGLDLKRQIDRIRSTPTISKSLRQIESQHGNVTGEHWFIPATKIPFVLASLETLELGPALKPVIEELQEIAADVLYEHFMGNTHATMLAAHAPVGHIDATNALGPMQKAIEMLANTTAMLANHATVQLPQLISNVETTLNGKLEVVATQQSVLSDQYRQLQAQVNQESGWYCIRAYMKVRGLDIRHDRWSSIGSRCTRLCEERGVTPGKVTDERFGYVGSYPEHVIDEAIVQLEWEGKL